MLGNKRKLPVIPFPWKACCCNGFLTLACLHCCLERTPCFQGTRAAELPHWEAVLTFPTSKIRIALTHLVHRKETESLWIKVTFCAFHDWGQEAITETKLWMIILKLRSSLQKIFLDFKLSCYHRKHHIGIKNVVFQITKDVTSHLK